MGFSMGVPQARWMIYFMENPSYKWMIGGYLYFRKPPYGNYNHIVIITIG